MGHRFALRRRNWRRTEHLVGAGPARGGNHGWFRLPGSVRVATFADAGAAQAERRRLEGEARAVINPFRCGSSLSEQTSLDEGRLCDWLLDHGLTPPAAERRDWVKWYDGHRAALDASQREKVWEALDRLAFYEVVEGPVCPLVFATVEIPWDFTGGPAGHFFTNDEGGEVKHVFRTRSAADRFCRGKHSQGWDGDERHEMTDRKRLRDDPLGLREPEEVWFDGEAPELDVIEVEVMDAGARGKVLSADSFPAAMFLVCRPGWWVELDGRAFELNAFDSTHVPVAAWAGRAGAKAHAAELTRQAHAELSPAVVLRQDVLDNFSGLGEKKWHRRLAALGVEPPATRGAGRRAELDWRAWCDSVAPRLSGEQQAAIWELCDLVPWYDVVKVATRR